MKQILKKRELKENQSKALNRAINYFENHRQWVRYDEYLKAVYPIDTGFIEDDYWQSNMRLKPISLYGEIMDALGCADDYVSPCCIDTINRLD